jgi:hypothetical protein
MNENDLEDKVAGLWGPPVETSLDQCSMSGCYDWNGHWNMREMIPLDVHSCPVPTCLPFFNSVQKFACDIVGNIVTISINQALKSIYPVDKDHFDHFDHFD